MNIIENHGFTILFGVLSCSSVIASIVAGTAEMLDEYTKALLAWTAAALFLGVIGGRAIGKERVKRMEYAREDQQRLDSIKAEFASLGEMEMQLLHEMRANDNVALIGSQDQARMLAAESLMQDGYIDPIDFCLQDVEAEYFKINRDLVGKISKNGKEWSEAEKSVGVPNPSLFPHIEPVPKKDDSFDAREYLCLAPSKQTRPSHWL